MTGLQNKKVMLAVVVAVLLVLGGVTYWYLNRQGSNVVPPAPPGPVETPAGPQGEVPTSSGAATSTE